MKQKRILTYITAMTFLAALAIGVRLAAQAPQQTPPNYTITDLGTLGGTMTYPGWINNKGEVTGTSALASDSVYHAFIWKDGVMTDFAGGPYISL